MLWARKMFKAFRSFSFSSFYAWGRDTATKDYFAATFEAPEPPNGRMYSFGCFGLAVHRMIPFRFNDLSADLTAVVPSFVFFVNCSCRGWQ